MNSELQCWLVQQGAGEIIESSRKSGGSINQARSITTQNGHQFFVKLNHNAPAGMFLSEAKSLNLMATSSTLPVPKPFYWNDECLVMELIEPGPKQLNYWEEFGIKLAHMHQTNSDLFGLDFQTYCGTTLQSNHYRQDGYQFFAEQRLLPLSQQAMTKNYFNSSDMKNVECLCKQLPELVPKQPASLIHGDLWSGNAHTTAKEGPVLIDPALHFGWREAEIAMTRLFGSFPDSFYDAYHQTWPLEKDWENRSDIYNLYHLLNHLVLFGRSYLAQARAILERHT